MVLIHLQQNTQKVPKGSAESTLLLTNFHRPYLNIPTVRLIICCAKDIYVRRQQKGDLSIFSAVSWKHKHIFKRSCIWFLQQLSKIDSKSNYSFQVFSAPSIFIFSFLRASYTKINQEGLWRFHTIINQWES